MGLIELESYSGKAIVNGAVRRVHVEAAKITIETGSMDLGAGIINTLGAGGLSEVVLPVVAAVVPHAPEAPPAPVLTNDAIEKIQRELADTHAAIRRAQEEIKQLTSQLGAAQQEIQSLRVANASLVTELQKRADEPKEGPKVEEAPQQPKSAPLAYPTVATTATPSPVEAASTPAATPPPAEQSEAANVIPIKAELKLPPTDDAALVNLPTTGAVLSALHDRGMRVPAEVLKEAQRLRGIVPVLGLIKANFDSRILRAWELVASDPARANA